jgi:hypothetical protein
MSNDPDPAVVAAAGPTLLPGWRQNRVIDLAPKNRVKTREDPRTQRLLGKLDLLRRAVPHADEGTASPTPTSSRRAGHPESETADHVEVRNGGAEDSRRGRCATVPAGRRLRRWGRSRLGSHPRRRRAVAASLADEPRAAWDRPTTRPRAAGGRARRGDADTDEAVGAVPALGPSPVSPQPTPSPSPSPPPPSPKSTSVRST